MMVTHFTASVRENNSTKKSLGNYTSSCGSLALCECLKTFQWVDSSLASLLVYFGTWNSSAYVHSNDATPAPRKRNCVKYYMDVLFTAFLGPSNWSHFFMSLTSSLVFFFPLGKLNPTSKSNQTVKTWCCHNNFSSWAACHLSPFLSLNSAPVHVSEGPKEAYFSVLQGERLPSRIIT